MAYELFTLPNCSHCQDVKSFLEERGIPYEEKTAVGPGRKDFQKFYSACHEFIERKEKEGIVFPIFVEWEDDKSRFVRILQREEKIKALFGG